MDTHGRHLLVEYMNCNADVLNDVNKIEALMLEAAIAARTKVVFSKFKPFVPQGVSGVVVVEESHLSIHTWPEYGYAAVDFYTCGDGDPNEAHEVLREGLGAASFEMLYVERGRGIEGHGPCMNLQSHTRDTLPPPTVSVEMDSEWPWPLDARA